jgi:predicted Zn-dependent protease
MSPAKKSRSASGRGERSSAQQLRSERELRAITERVLRIGKASGIAEVEVHVGEVMDALTRFANNTIHQHVAEHGLTVSLRVIVDGRTARVTTNRVDEDSLRAALESAASLASSEPKDSGLLPLPAKQKYRAIRRFVPATAALSADARARAVKSACSLAESKGQIAAGIFSSGQSQSVLANSRGLFAAYRQTQAEFSVTMQQGSATSWAKANTADYREFDPHSLAKTASEKAARAENPVELAPGRYIVIFEPAAVVDLIGFLFYDFSATAVRDQRSCFSGRLGKPLLGKNVTISDDVYHPEQLGAPFDGEGMPRQRVVLVENGIPRNLVYSRGSAKKAGVRPTGHGFALPNEHGEAPVNLVVTGGKTSVPEMIAATGRGLLVTRLWYIREVDPYEKIMTGMTRDGLFLVENGKVTKSVRNFRFNQSILEMLRNVECLGPSHRATAEESFEMVVPPMKIRDFHFSEVTKF